ncbi:MAG: type II toxin-antitoxin system RelE/ParE family toxin, partial [Hymenobacter sp.]|nr:type II toxin-antitoxin system RelE/ParE family toxin [Hymenobacter sp.]
MEDIHAASEYHRPYSAGYANALIDRIFEKALLLESFPQSGRVVPEFNRSDVWEVIYKPYRILYQLQSQGQIFILAI